MGLYIVDTQHNYNSNLIVVILSLLYVSNAYYKNIFYYCKLTKCSVVKYKYGNINTEQHNMNYRNNHLLIVIKS